MPPQRRVAALHGVLDVLRVMVGAADDDDLLDAAGDEQLARRVEKAEIAGAQPALAFLARYLSGEGRRACLGVAPVAARDIGAGDPDLADQPGVEPPAVVGIDDRDPLA